MGRGDTFPLLTHQHPYDGMIQRSVDFHEDAIVYTCDYSFIGYAYPNSE